MPSHPSWSAEPVGPDQLPFRAQFAYPIVPTHRVHIEFSDGPRSSVTMVLHAVYDAGRWYEVLPCPTPDTIARMRTAKEERVRRHHRAQQLAAQLAEPMRAELARLVKGGQMIDAIKQYAASSGEDLAMAKQVVELVVPEQ